MKKLQRHCQANHSIPLFAATIICGKAVRYVYGRARQSPVVEIKLYVSNDYPQVITRVEDWY